MRFRDLIWLLKGLIYRLRYPQISGGKLLKVKGRIFIEGNGKVELGKGVLLDGRFDNPVILKVSDGGRIVLSDSTFINCGSYLSAGDGKIDVGEESGVGPFNIILGSNHDKIADSEPKKGVDIGSNVLVYSNCKILPGTKIGEDCVIGAGSVLPSKDFGSQKLIAGNPAKSVKEDIEVLDR